MIFSYSWLSEMLDGLTLGPQELTQLITIKTAESEGVEPWGGHFAEVVAARVVRVEPIEGSGNVVATVDAGRLGERRVVCGAPNCRAGMVTAYVPPGVTLPDGKVIQRAKVSGQDSDGMLASGAELGINKDDEGVLELGLMPGERLVESDWLIEIDNKSLTHRPDLWGHYGMAREVAAISGARLKDPVEEGLLPDSGGGWPVRVEDFVLCPRYSALVVEGVAVGESPLWLQGRLTALGMNPINSIVDLTNYVAAEIAQPMHAFDADQVRGAIVVRAARGGEVCEALNGESYGLTEAALVIADDGGPIAIAGVMGGSGSSVTGSTTRVVFESANFHAASVRKTASRLKLRTDASMRFEKSQDPVNTVRGLARVVALLREVCPGARIGGLTDVWAKGEAASPIRLPLGWLDRKLGKHVEGAEVARILRSLEFGVEESGEELVVTVPSWRATKDISQKEDLVEEVGRMIGYSSIRPVPPLVPSVAPQSNPVRGYLQQVREVATGRGFDEVYNYSFVSDELAREYGLDPGDHLRVENPIASDLNLMRRSLVPRIGENVNENRKHFDAFRLFEIGREIDPREGGLPEERLHLVAASYRKQDGEGLCLDEVKSLAEVLLPGFAVEPGGARAYEHPARAGAVRWRGEVVGRVFELHPRLVDTGRAALLEVDLELVRRLGAREVKYRAVRKVPATAFDLSVIVQARDLVGSLKGKLVELAGEELEKVEFLVDYALGDGTRSVSFRLTLAAPGRTMTAEEAATVRGRIVEGLKGAGYGFRG